MGNRSRIVEALENSFQKYVTSQLSLSVSAQSIVLTPSLETRGVLFEVKQQLNKQVSSLRGRIEHGE